MSMLDAVRWNADGLVCAIAQDAATRELLMVAWMNREALDETLRTGRGVYFSRSRAKLWRKGEESGHAQLVKSVRLDCDGDAVLLEIEQIGGIACHTGRRSCFFRQAVDGAWRETDAPIKDPFDIYRGQP